MNLFRPACGKPALLFFFRCSFPAFPGFQPSHGRTLADEAF
jgi:hypothetical protein